MAEKVYELAQFRARDTWWQLSEEERKSLVEKIGKVFNEVGAKQLAGFRTYSSEWRAVHVWVYPEMEAYHKWTVAIGPKELNAQRYWDTDFTLGYEPPA